jgi:cell division protein FtsW (lipid II flippase)
MPASISASLLRLAVLFLGAYALALTISPAVRDRSFDGLGELRWAHWLGIAVWAAAFFLLDYQARRWLPNRDPYLVPLAGLLSGWGLLTIWRLTTFFGLRQTLWVAICAALFMWTLRWKDSVLSVLRRFKYLWLLAGFIITALTFLFGTNPSGVGPELWLGCCGIYFQPSEILKLLLIAYLAAYLAERQPLTPELLPLLAPTALMTGIALLLLLVQHDLGTAWVFIFIYTILVYAAAGKRRVLLAALFILVLALIAGYELVGLVHLRILAWLNPWADPAGSAYQIIQGLLAVASGGLFGRGPGMGLPGVVPVAHSDFIFTSIAEETGLLGAVGLILLIAFLCVRALRISLHARDAYQRYLAIGLSAYLASQSLLIIGGNIRMLPLTGVTLPFVSYGGSSMLASFFALLLLSLISNEGMKRSTPVSNWKPTLLIAGILISAFALAALITGWWSVVRAPDLLTRVDNARRALSDSFVPRGALTDREGRAFNETGGVPGDYLRRYLYPELVNVLGYSDPKLGQSGLEDVLDPILRGEEDQPAFTLWLNHLLYGQPAPGLDVRLTLDQELEFQASQLLANQPGAIVAMDAGTGEILAMVSAPTFDPATIDEDWQSLFASEESPLLNRAVQGAYAPGPALGPFLLAAVESNEIEPELPEDLSFSLEGERYNCFREPQDDENWAQLIKAGCPGALAQLGLAMGGESILDLFSTLGFYSVPNLPLDIHTQTAPSSMDRPEATATGQDGLQISPLQMAMAACTLSNQGELVEPQITFGVEQAESDLENLLAEPSPIEVFSRSAAASVAQGLAVGDMPIWELTTLASGDNGRSITWYLGGTLPGLTGTDGGQCIVVMLEANRPALARSIGRELLLSSTSN